MVSFSLEISFYRERTSALLLIADDDELSFSNLFNLSISSCSVRVFLPWMEESVN